MNKADAEKMLRDEFSHDVDLKYVVTEFPSGALDIELRYRGHFAVIQGKDSEWGLSVDAPDGEGFTAHRNVLDSLGEAVTAATTAMRAPAPPEVGNGQGWLQNRLTDTTTQEEAGN